MKRLSLILLLSALPAFGSAAFSCPDGTGAACLDAGDKVCTAGTRCVDEDATCLADFPCSLDAGFVCADEHEAALQDCKVKLAEYDALVKENVDLRQQRLERKNCVLNSENLADAQRCVR